MPTNVLSSHGGEMMTSQQISSGKSSGIHNVTMAIRANPHDPFAWFSLGHQLLSRKCPADALECFEKAEDIKANFSAANRYLMALALRDLSRNTDSLASLRIAAQINAINHVDRKARSAARRLLDAMDGRGVSAPPTLGRVSPRCKLERPASQPKLV